MFASPVVEPSAPELATHQRSFRTKFFESFKLLVDIGNAKYGKGEIPTSSGASFQVKETGVKYDFSQCNDPVWNNLKEQADRINEQLKEREKYLKVIKNPKTEIDEETGEVYTIIPPTRTSTTSYTVTFKKG